MTIDEAIAHAREVAKNKRKEMQCKTCKLFVRSDLRPLQGYCRKNEFRSIEIDSWRKVCSEYVPKEMCKCAEEHEQIAEWLEKLQYIENIILKWNADWYNDEDTGIPDNEILEAIFNACTDNGFDIQIDEDYREGYNKAIDDFADRLSEYLGVENATKYGNKDADQQKNSYSTIMKYEIADAIEDVAEQLKEGGTDAGRI